jgi:hypothetical protein
MYGKAGTHVVRKIALLHGAEIVGKKISPVTATVEGVAVSIETVKKSIELVEYFLVHGAEAARLMVCPPEDGFEVARGDDEILHLLRSDLRGDEEREATPSEWADRLNRSAGDGTALSPEQVGHAFTRLRETRGSCFVFEKSRGRVRSWKVRRVRPAAGEGRP